MNETRNDPENGEPAGDEQPAATNQESWRGDTDPPGAAIGIVASEGVVVDDDDDDDEDEDED
jgi:hypothetical protein